MSPNLQLQEPGPANVALRAERRSLVVLPPSARVLERLRAAGALQLEEGVLELPRREVPPC